MPVVCIMLACASLGNLVQSYGDTYRNILGAIALILFIIATIKFLTDINGLKQELDTPIGGSVFLTYPMGIVILATYVNPYGFWVLFYILFLCFDFH